MNYYRTEVGAAADQAYRAHPQVPACIAIIPPQATARLMETAPPMTQEQVQWMGRLLRSIDRAQHRQQEERHERIVDALASAVTALSLIIIFYLMFFLAAV